MKFPIGLMVLCFLMSTRSEGQDVDGLMKILGPDHFFENSELRFYGGPEIGCNFTQVDGDAYSGYSKVGLTGGGLVYVRFSENTGVAMELIYSQKGSKGVVNYTNPYTGLNQGFQTYRLNLNYVEVPIVLHFETGLRLHYEIGLSYGQLISSKEAVDGDPGVYIDPDTHRFIQFDLEGIAGFEYHLGGDVFFEGRFQYSLT